jgi:hypothetical protein
VNVKKSRATNSCVHISLRNLANGGIHLRLLSSIISLKYRKCVFSFGCGNSPGVTVCVADGRPSLLIPGDVSRRPVAYGIDGLPSTSRCLPRRFPLGLGDSLGCLGRQSSESILFIILGRSSRHLIVDTHKSGRIEGSTRQRLVMLSRIPRTGIKWLHEKGRQGFELIHTLSKLTFISIPKNISVTRTC